MKKLKLFVVLSPCAEPREWYTVNEISYKGIVVPKGFITDLASIPTGLRWLFPHGGAKAFGSVVHDYIYRTQEQSRSFADDLFFDAMIENGVSRYKAKAMYAAVRKFGNIAWKANRLKYKVS